MEYAAQNMDVLESVAAKKLLDALAALIGAHRFELWLGSEVRLRFEGKSVVLGLSNPFAVRWVRSNILPEISQACLAVFGEARAVDILVVKPEKAGQEWIVPVPTSVTKQAAVLASVSPSLSHRKAVVAASPVAVSAATVFASASTPLVSPLLDSPVPEEKLPPFAATSGVVKPSLPRPLNTLHSPIQSLAATVPETSKTPTGRRFASLETFCEGLSNRLACRAADLAIHHPCQINPIYIFGPTSVGKTHILEGIWSEIRRRKDRKPPLYLTAEQFISAFLESIQSGSRDGIQRFRNRFKGISTLLVDDIQFLARAAATQVELLHVLDSLRQQGVQIVLTGDRPLKELKGIRSEILCRLEAGMVCGIELPEREMLLSIFSNMVAVRKLPIGQDVCRMVASRLGTHARQLCGALNRLHAVHLATGKPITLEVANETLADLVRANRRHVRLPDIEKAVCETLGLSEDSLRSKSRARQISSARMLAMWLARKYTRSALSEIGKFFGDRSHSTVVTAQKKVDAWIDAKHPIHADHVDLPIADAIQRIEQVLHAG